jgi:hypothetical protein
MSVGGNEGGEAGDGRGRKARGRNNTKAFTKYIDIMRLRRSRVSSVSVVTGYGLDNHCRVRTRSATHLAS